MLKVFFLNAIATPEDYRICSVSTGPTGICWSNNKNECAHHCQRELSSLDEVTWELQTECFTTGDMPKHGTAVVGLPDVANMMKNNDNVAKKWLRLISNSFGLAYWTLAAVGLWMLAAATGLLEWMDMGGWFDVPVIEWAIATKDKLNSARRTLTLFGFEHLPVEDALMLRKLPNITARNKEQADWQAEEHRRTVNTPAHMMPMRNGTLSRDRWTLNMYKYLQGFTDQVVSNMINNMRLEDMDTWWSSRAAWAPQGSSSQSADAVKALQADMEEKIPVGARANKRAVAVTLCDEYFKHTITQMPIKQPRCSTKNEPGMKNRALFAQDDQSFFISSFASVAMEKNINIDGIYAQQSPDDVATWVRNHQFDSKMGCHFLSLDYSDYNSEHEITALAMVDACFAKSWIELGGGSKLSKEKALASMWSARAHMNAWVKFPHDEVPQRINSGLFSGDRNTSRDNCILHAAYSNAMQWAAQQIIPDFEIVNIAMTGDDEDASFLSWVDALLYMALHAQAGFVLKVAKQLSGSGTCPTHEYLQRSVTTDARPSRPLAAALAQVMSGNWYKDQYIWFDGIITSVSSNCWELHTRGLPLIYARQLAAIVLNRVMVVKRDDDWVKLEWWTFRTNGSWDPLWDTVSMSAPLVPTGDDAILGPVFSNGMQAWRNKNMQRFHRHLPPAKMDRYMLSVSKEVYGCLWPKERNKLMHNVAANVWPKRSNMWNKELDRKPDVINRRVNQAVLSDLLKNEVVDRLPATEAQLASKFGLDTNLLLALGGWKKVLQMLPPDDMRHWTAVTQPIEIPKWASYEDPALRSWLSTAFANHRDISHYSPAGMASSRSVNVVLAGNGSGKTTFKLSQPDGLVADMDEIFSRSGINRWLKNNPGARNKNIPMHYNMDAAHRLTNDPPQLLMTQYPHNLVKPILEYAGLVIDQVFVVETEVISMWERTTNNRAWAIAKCERRFDRFADTVVQWKKKYNGVLRNVPDIQSAWAIISQKEMQNMLF